MKLSKERALARLKYFKADLKGGSSLIVTAVGAFIAAVIIIIAGVHMTPIVATEVDTVIFQNSSDWNFTGASGAAALMGLIPFVFIAGLLIAAVAIVFAWAKKSD